MKRQIALATAFSAALAAGAAAQTGTQTPQQQPQQQSQRGEQVTMTGCLERAPMGTAGTTGTAGTSGQAEFILSHATRSGAAGTAGTTGAETRPSAMDKDNKYRLMGGNREDMQKYLNSKVEIRGTLDKSSMSGTGAATGTGTGTGTGATGTRAGQSETDKLPILRVTSVRQISPTCDEK